MWRTNDGFSIKQHKGFTGNAESVWKVVPNFEKTGNIPYMGALHTIGQEQLDRKRETLKETSKRPFDSTIMTDRKNPASTNSIRMGKSLNQ